MGANPTSPLFIFILLNNMTEFFKECYLNHSIKVEVEYTPEAEDHIAFETYFISIDGRGYDCAFYEEQAFEKVSFLKGRLDQQIELA